MRESKISILECKFLIAETELFFAWKAAKESVVHVEAKSDKLGPHGEGMYASMRALVAAKIAGNNQFTKLIVRNPVKPQPGVPQFGQTRKQ